MLDPLKDLLARRVSVRRVLVTGARAKTGEPLTRLLATAPGLEVLAGSRDPSGVEVDPGPVHPVRFSWDDDTSWDVAEDADAVFVVRPDRPDAPELVAALLDRTPPRAHVVLLSEMDRDYFAEDDWAPRTERAVRESGRSWTILRPGWFMQVFTDERFWLDDLRRGTLAFPAGDQRVAWIDARDIAAVAARALLDPSLTGTVLDLTGPQALSLDQTVEILTGLVGRPVTHVDLALEEALGDATGFERDNDRGAYERVLNGDMAHVSNTVERVTGRPARTLADFVADHAMPQPSRS